MVKEEHQGNLVIFRNGSIYGTKFNDEIDGWEYIYLNPKNILHHLEEPIILEDGFTLRDYFNLVINYYPLRLLDYFIDCHIDEFEKCPNEGCLSDEFDYITISKFTYFSKGRYLKLFGDEYDEVYMDDMIEDSINVDGICKSLIEDNDKMWGIELADLNELLDHEIIINKHYIYIEVDENDPTNLIKRETDIDRLSLYEFFKNIIWELSFFGCPGDKTLNLDNIERDSDEQKNQ